MKGYTVATYLVPYGPEKPKSGMVKESSTNQVEVFWYPPTGDFKKYLLCLEKIADQDESTAQKCITNFPAIPSNKLNASFNFDKLIENDASVQKDTFRWIENLTTKDTTYTIPGLDPGEKYLIHLLTKNGDIVAITVTC